MSGDRFILIGRLAGAHGIRGGLKLVSYAESLDLFAAGRTVRAVGSAGEASDHAIREARPRGRGAVLFLEGIDGRRQAEALAGRDLYIDRTALPPLAEGEYYWFDLIGLEVVAADGRRLGRLEAVIPTGSNDVYVVSDAGRETLVPALKSVIREVDLAARRMRVELPEGLAQE